MLTFIIGFFACGLVVLVGLPAFLLVRAPLNEDRVFLAQAGINVQAIISILVLFTVMIITHHGLTFLMVSAAGAYAVVSMFLYTIMLCRDAKQQSTN